MVDVDNLMDVDNLTDVDNLIDVDNFGITDLDRFGMV